MSRDGGVKKVLFWTFEIRTTGKGFSHVFKKIRDFFQHFCMKNATRDLR